MIKNKLQIDQKPQKLKIERSELMGLNSVKFTGLRFLILVLLTSNFLLLICGQVWGSADTLQPKEDGVKVEWAHTGCAVGERYDCVDDPPGSPDGTDTYAYTSGAVAKQEYFRCDSTFVSDIDSVIIRINAKKTGAETAKLYVGWAYWSELMWNWWTDDSVTLTTSWADYSANLDDDPSWTYQEVNARRFGVKYAPSWQADWDTVLQDNFNDNSLDTDKWRERHTCNSAPCPDVEAVEQNQRMEFFIDHTSHAGSGILTKVAYDIDAIYVLETEFLTTWDHETSASEYGHDGIWILKGDTTASGFWQGPHYGTPTTGVFFRIGGGCGEDNDGVGIYANDYLGWSCPWSANGGEVVDEDESDIIEVDTWYDVKIVFNGTDGTCSLFIDDVLKANGTINSTHLAYLGDSVYFHMHQSYLNDDGSKIDKYDDFLLASKELYDVNNQLTQVFVIVYGAEEAKKQGGIVQDKDSKGLVEGGIAR